jgi:hypothetical protein
MADREGSRKQKVHALFDAEGESAAYTLGRKLKLKETSLRKWFGMWRAETVQANLAKIKKAKAKKAATTAAVA